MPANVVIIHGWSDTSKSFRPLRDYLSDHGHQVSELWLGDYISMDDDVHVEDVAKKMQEVVASYIGDGRLTQPFDLIVHSTGGLVVRDWIWRFHAADTPCPAKRVIMLAPANFGSKLASTGRSLLGRVIKGWGNWFHTGKRMLDDLELASAYQWDLARRDLLDPTGASGEGPYGPGKIWPFVIVGTHGYSDGLQRVVNENGSDGTVRVPAANLNAVGMTIDFTKAPFDAPALRPWGMRTPIAIPFAVLPGRNHGSIIHPETGPEGLDDQLGKLILDALACPDDAGYARIAADWEALTDATGRLATDAAARHAQFNTDVGAEPFHQYLQAVVRVIDDLGRPVDDFFLEFFDPDSPGRTATDDTVFFQHEVLEDVHPNANMPSSRCLYVDRTDLATRFYTAVNAKRIAMSISAAPIGDHIHYFDDTRIGAKGSVTIHAEAVDERDTLDARLFHNRTHLVEIIIPRQGTADVFRLSQ